MRREPRKVIHIKNVNIPNVLLIEDEVEIDDKVLDAVGAWQTKTLYLGCPWPTGDEFKKWEKRDE